MASGLRQPLLLRTVDRADAPPATPPLGPDAFACYALGVSDVAPESLGETFVRILRRPEDTIISTLERMFQNGKAEGKEEGKAEGRAATILRMLDKRFGSLDATVEQRVRQAVRSSSTPGPTASSTRQRSPPCSTVQSTARRTAACSG